MKIKKRWIFSTFFYFCIEQKLCLVCFITKSRQHTTIDIMETFHELISSSDVPVIVDFFAEWCSPCKTMSPILKQVKDMQGDKVRIVKVDVDKNNALAMQYSIQSVPTLMIFKNGKQMWRQSGVINAGELNKIVEMFK